jgi:hypothetical protein
MLVIFEGQKKDLHPTIAVKLLKAGKATIEEKTEVKKTRKKVTDE